jgi:hypothetical protein
MELLFLPIIRHWNSNFCSHHKWCKPLLICKHLVICLFVSMRPAFYSVKFCQVAWMTGLCQNGQVWAIHFAIFLTIGSRASYTLDCGKVGNCQGVNINPSKVVRSMWKMANSNGNSKKVMGLCEIVGTLNST